MLIKHQFGEINFKKNWVQNFWSAIDLLIKIVRTYQIIKWETLENEIDLHINVISLHNITAKRAINNFDVVGR